MPRYRNGYGLLPWTRVDYVLRKPLQDPSHRTSHHTLEQHTLQHPNLQLSPPWPPSTISTLPRQSPTTSRTRSNTSPHVPPTAINPQTPPRIFQSPLSLRHHGNRLSQHLSPSRTTLPPPLRPTTPDLYPPPHLNPWPKMVLDWMDYFQHPTRDSDGRLPPGWSHTCAIAGP